MLKEGEEGRLKAMRTVKEWTGKDLTTQQEQLKTGLVDKDCCCHLWFPNDWDGVNCSSVQYDIVYIMTQINHASVQKISSENPALIWRERLISK